MNEQDFLSAEEAYMNLHRRNPGRSEPAFEHTEMLEKVWGRQWGLCNDVGTLRMVMVCRPGKEWDVMMSGGEYVEEVQALVGPEMMWYWNDRQRPNLAKVQAQHDGLTNALRAEGVEVVNLEDPLAHLTRSVFTRDTAIIVKGGAVLCRFGVNYRCGEELPIMRALAKLGMPILHTIHGTGLMEGGSFMWLNAQTAAVSLGHRSNEEGIRQLAEVLDTQGVELLCVDNLVYGLHIDGKLVMVDSDLAVGFIHQLPWWFLERLKELGINVVYADPRDGPFGVNCLAVRPRKVIMSSHAERTAELLRRAGAEVVPIDYDELHKAGGGYIAQHYR
jgi:N-dimethylarginine dimethylaminohydrolase